MSVLYNEFCILSVVPDISQKRVIIKTNFKVDAATVDYETVSYYDYDRGQLAEYTLKVEGKEIHILLKDYPANNSRYYLKVTNIYDALNRQLNHAYNNYVKFINDVPTKIEIISPSSREAFSEKPINIRLKLDKPISDLTYRIEVSSDNAFFKKITTLLCKVPNEYLGVNNDARLLLSDKEEIITNNNGIPISVSDGYIYNDELDIQTVIDYNGQLYIRARAELTEDVVGPWSDLINFTVMTIHMDSLDTTFLEESIITDDLFGDGLLEGVNVTEQSTVVSSEDGAFYIEFNKEIIIPKEFKVTEDGYIYLQTATGFRKDFV